MANQRTETINLRTVKHVEWGTPGGTIESFDALLLPWQEAEQAYNAVVTGNEPSRDGRANTLARVFSNFGQGDANRQAGIWGRHDIGFFGRDSWRYYFNEGLITLPSGILCLPPALTTQTAVISSDHSGLNAGNRRVHTTMFKNRFVAFIGPNMIHDTSTSNPALTVPGTADNITDDVLSTWIGTVNGTEDCLIIGTDGQTDDAKYATAIAANMSWTSLVTYANAADRIWWGGWFPEIGNGWHIFGGKINNVAGIYAFKGSDSVPLTISTLAPVVFEATKDIPGTIATVTTSELSGAVFGQDGFSEDGPIGTTSTTGTTNNPGVWRNLDNLAADDAVYVTYELNVPDAGSDTNPDGYSNVTPYLIAGGFNHSIPRSAILVGAQAIWNASISSTSNLSVSFAGGHLLVGGAQRGDPRSTGQDIGATDEDVTLGASSDDWGARIEGTDFDYLAVAGRFAYSVTPAGATATRNIQADHLGLTLTYRVKGTQIDATQGGFTIGPIPNEPNVIPVIEPIVDDETAITVRRIYKEYTFSYDAEGDRPVGNVTIPPINLNYCGIMAHFQGGVAIAGGADENTWNEIRWRRADRQVINLRFPKFHGANQQHITHMRGNGEFLWVWVCDTDNGDAQLWLYHDGDWNVQGALQSKSNAIASRPLYWAESTHGAYQEVEYNFFPVSTTSLAGARQRVAKNPLIDPHLDMSSVTKQDGPLSLITPETAWVPPELSTAATTLELQTHRVDNNTSYGSVQAEVNNAGDLTLATAQIDETFDAAAEAFTQRNIVTATGNPGVTVPTGILRVTLDHQAGSAETPQGLPLVFTMETAWPGMRIFTFRIEAELGTRHPLDLLNTVGRLETLKRTKPTQRLYVDVEPFRSTNGLPAQYVGHSVVFTTTDRAKQTVDQIQYIDVSFREVPGAVSS